LQLDKILLENAENFSEHKEKKIRRKIPSRYRDFKKKTKIFHSVFVTGLDFSKSKLV